MSLPNFPAGIECTQQEFENWSLQIYVQELWTCAPKTPADVVALCNWAAAQGYKIRPRACMHGWSPLSVSKDTPPDAKVLMLDTTKHLNAMTFVPKSAARGPAVKVQTGASMEQLLGYLQAQSGGAGDAAGYAFTNTPAPGRLTVGGVLAINGHGTAVPSTLEGFDASYGSLSNSILELTAVVSEPSAPGTYRLKTFARSESQSAALLVHLGRAFVVDVTLAVIDNYNLRCVSYTDKTAEVLFKKPEGSPYPEGSLASYLNACGRVEAIWFPFSDKPWLKVWSHAKTKPESSVEVHSPYNYGFSDNLPEWVTGLIKAIDDGAPQLTPTLGQAMYTITDLGLTLSTARDLWGPSMNTLLYVKDTTLRVTANGYAIAMKKQDVQRGIHEFTSKFQQMLKAYQDRDEFPVNSPLEIRVTGLDDPKPLGAGCPTPALSALTYDDEAQRNGWDVALWLDVLTLPGTPGANAFYAELEDWMYTNFTGAYARVMPEWSKGWAYSATQGAWSNAARLEQIRASFKGSDGRNWDWELQQLSEADSSTLFVNPFLGTLFTQA